MVFVEQMPARMLRIHQLLQFLAQDFHLIVGKNANTLQVAFFAEEFKLVLAQAVLLPVSGAVEGGTKFADRLVISRQLFAHGRSLRRKKVLRQGPVFEGGPRSLPI